MSTMAADRETELSPADVRKYYRERVVALKETAAKEWRGGCPVHCGKDLNFAVNSETGEWFCHSQCGRGGDVFELEMLLQRLDFTAAKESVFTIIGRPSGGNRNHERQIVAEYDYCDETGKLLFQVVRFNPKAFAQRRPDGAGGWAWSLSGVRRVLYRLPEVLGAKVVYIAEGERDVETLRRLGIPATCNAEGVGKWRDEFSQFLQGKKVVILPDADDCGRRHALAVAGNLLPVAAAVKVVELPGAKDVTAWVEVGHRKQELTELVKATPVLDATGLKTLERRWFTGVAERENRIHRVEDVPNIWDFEAQVEWLVEDLIPAGGVTLLTGESGVGKSTLATMLAGTVAQGARCLGRLAQQREVLYLDRENPVAAVKDRLQRLGMTRLENLHIWGGWVNPAPPGPAATLVMQFAERKPLIICDSLAAFHPQSEQDANETRRFLDQFRYLTNLGATVLLIHHSSEKTQTAKNYRGSSDFKASVDAAFVLENLNPDRPGLDRLRLRNFKSRLTPGRDLVIEYRPGVGFEICANGVAAVAETNREAVERIVRERPGLDRSELVGEARRRGVTRDRARELVVAGEAQGWLRVEDQERGKKAFFPAPAEVEQGEF